MTKITPQANECSKIDKLAAELLTKLKERQDKTRKENSLEKSLQKKRLVFGAHETLKSVQRGNARLVFYAKNLDENNVRAASNFHSLQKLCPLENIPLIEVLTRREMSRIANKYPYVGVIGVLDVSLVESIANEIVTEWRSSDSYKLYHIDQSSLLP
ncbi:unnamed protein product [Caenorhabditis brenneri]